VSYASSDSATYYVDLNFSGAQSIGADYGTDTLVSIEGIVGHDGSDVFLGNGNANYLDGSNGNDPLNGAGGNDTLGGGGGNDYLNGGEGDDSLYGGSGNDTLIGGNGNDSLAGNYGADSLNGGQGADAFAFYDGGTGEFSGSAVSAGTFDIVGDFSHNDGDTLNFWELADGDSGNYYEGSVSTFAQAQTAADDQFGGSSSIRYVAIEVTDDIATYLFAQHSTTYGDHATMVVKLDGVNLTGIGYGDIFGISFD